MMSIFIWALQYAGMFFSKSAPTWITKLSLPTALAFTQIYYRYNRKYRPNVAGINCFDTGSKPLKVKQMLSVFYLMAAGFAIATMAFAWELIVGKSQFIQQQLDYFASENNDRQTKRSRRSRSLPAKPWYCSEISANLDFGKKEHGQKTKYNVLEFYY